MMASTGTPSGLENKPHRVTSSLRKEETRQSHTYQFRQHALCSPTPVPRAHNVCPPSAVPRQPILVHTSHDRSLPTRTHIFIHEGQKLQGDPRAGIAAGRSRCSDEAGRVRENKTVKGHKRSAAVLLWRRVSAVLTKSASGDFLPKHWFRSSLRRAKGKQDAASSVFV
jgi:hypothetical protein